MKKLLPYTLSNTVAFFLIFFVFVANLAFPSLALAQSATSEKCVTKVGSPDPSKNPSPGPLGCDKESGGGPPGACGDPPAANYTTAQEYADAIKQKWGITFNGFSLDQVQAFWTEFYMIDCIGLLQDIKGTTIEPWNNTWSAQDLNTPCPKDGGVNMHYGVGFHGDFNRALIAHELTHVWQTCSPRGEENLLEIPDAYSGEGGISKYSRNECPDFKVIVPANNYDNHINEDHADTIALYYNADSGELTCGNGAPNPFAALGAYSLHTAVAQHAKL